MSNKTRNALAARAAAVASGRTPTPTHTPDAESASTASSNAVPTESAVSATSPVPQRRVPMKAPRSRPVRITVDLPPIEHRQLKRWCDNSADELELASVPAAEVVRVLLGLLAGPDDQQLPGLADRVRAELTRRRL